MLPTRIERLFSQCIRKGFWFCEHCDRVHSVGLDADKAQCPHCKKNNTSYWTPAVL